MESTIELLDRALKKAKQEDPHISRRQLSQRLGMSPTALTTATQRGNLSPVAAGQLAAMLGENVEHWIALAALEGSPKTRATEALKRVIVKTAKS